MATYHNLDALPNGAGRFCQALNQKFIQGPAAFLCRQGFGRPGQPLLSGAAPVQKRS